jgi:hypothetical protein
MVCPDWLNGTCMKIDVKFSVIPLKDEDVKTVENPWFVEALDLVRSRLFVCILVLFLLSVAIPNVFAVSNGEAQDAINRAESAMNSAYKSVLEAEQAGADVSSLLSELNSSSALLSEAYMWYRVGNFSEAKDFANRCYDSLNGVAFEANESREFAVVTRKQNMLISATLSMSAICAIWFISFYGWRLFKRRYYEQVLQQKPEVQTDDIK